MNDVCTNCVNIVYLRFIAQDEISINSGCSSCYKKTQMFTNNRDKRGTPYTKIRHMFDILHVNQVQTPDRLGPVATYVRSKSRQLARRLGGYLDDLPERDSGEYSSGLSAT